MMTTLQLLALQPGGIRPLFGGNSNATQAECVSVQALGGTVFAGRPATGLPDHDEISAIGARSPMGLATQAFLILTYLAITAGLPNHHAAKARS